MLVRLAVSGISSMVLLSLSSLPRSWALRFPVASVLVVIWSILRTFGSISSDRTKVVFQSPLLPTMNIHSGEPGIWLLSAVASTMSMRL